MNANSVLLTYFNSGIFVEMKVGDQYYRSRVKTEKGMKLQTLEEKLPERMKVLIETMQLHLS